MKFSNVYLKLSNEADVGSKNFKYGKNKQICIEIKICQIRYSGLRLKS